MSDPGSVTLQSTRLAKYLVTVPCFICGEDNACDAELCHQCQAPMALAHQARRSGVSPQLVATLGSADAGKTVFLGMLTDILSRSRGPLQLLARGAISVSLQQATMTALSRCRFPEKTPSEPDRWNWVHCQIRHQDRPDPVELLMPDVSGEAILHEIDHPHTFPVIRAFLQRCQGALVLIDARRLAEGENDQDYFALKTLAYLVELAGQEDPHGWVDRPIAVVITKADLCPNCFEDPSGFARQHAPALWQFSQQRLNRCRFFAAGVAGACAYRLERGMRIQIPLRIEPRGIVEPFAWVVEQLPKQGRRKKRWWKKR